MSLEVLNEKEKQVVFDCLRAAVEGPFFPECEFHTLIGLNRDDVAEIIASIPLNENVSLAINNAMLNLLCYPHGQEAALLQFVSTPESEVRRIFDKWRMSRNGVA